MNYNTSSFQVHTGDQDNIIWGKGSETMSGDAGEPLGISSLQKQTSADDVQVEISLDTDSLTLQIVIWYCHNPHNQEDHPNGPWGAELVVCEDCGHERCPVCPIERQSETPEALAAMHGECVVGQTSMPVEYLGEESMGPPTTSHTPPAEENR
jgi:hypothetical protein